MTIEEAIQHCKETAMENRRSSLEFARVNACDAARSCQECAAEHEQLAEWLTELKQRREAEISKKPETNGDKIRAMTDEELSKHLNSYICDNRGSGDCQRFETCEECKLSWVREEAATDECSESK